MQAMNRQERCWKYSCRIVNAALTAVENNNYNNNMHFSPLKEWLDWKKPHSKQHKVFPRLSPRL